MLDREVPTGSASAPFSVGRSLISQIRCLLVLTGHISHACFCDGDGILSPVFSVEMQEDTSEMCFLKVYAALGKAYFL